MGGVSLLTHIYCVRGGGEHQYLRQQNIFDQFSPKFYNSVSSDCEIANFSFLKSDNLIHSISR